MAMPSTGNLPAGGTFLPGVRLDKLEDGIGRIIAHFLAHWLSFLVSIYAVWLPKSINMSMEKAFPVGVESKAQSPPFHIFRLRKARTPVTRKYQF
jgi:hypothetical protein